MFILSDNCFCVQRHYVFKMASMIYRLEKLLCPFSGEDRLGFEVIIIEICIENAMR